ncbi:MAG: D-alanyl-D-alanine carboxypeptidase/D-alanyl-D-alanine-endopeptidase [Casimicrobiaceae bacterium]
MRGGRGDRIAPRRLARFRRRGALGLWIALALVAGITEAALPRPLGRAFLDAGIPLDAVAIVVQEVTARQPFVAHRGNAAMNPASVMKLVTTYAALEMLGPNYRWRTEAYALGPVANGVLAGDLVLKGHGDPKITIEQWQALVAALRAAGIARITGDLVLDRTWFELPPHDRGLFDAAPLRPYNVGPDALLVNFNTVRMIFTPDALAGTTRLTLEPPLPAVRVINAPLLGNGPCNDWRADLLPVIINRGVDAELAFAGAFPASCGERSWYLALLDAPNYAHAMFAAYFRAAGGQFEGGWRAGQAPADARPVALLESPPLYDIVRDVNKLSNNVMARQIFLTLGVEDSGPPATVARSTAAIRRFLAAHKLAMPALLVENGSGLSRTEKVSAGGLARLLLAAEHSAVREEFSTSLAVAATDGTVERRFQNGRVAGQALLKTGSLEGVRALAGYVLDAGGRRFLVVALVNHPEAARAQPALDFLVQWVFQEGAAWARGIPPR